MREVKLTFEQWLFLAPDRHVICGHAWDRQWRFACSLPLDHGGDDHEDHVTDAPSVVAWRKPAGGLVRIQ